MQEEGFPTLGTEWRGRSAAEVCTSEARKIRVPLARARGGASQEGLVSLLGAERMRSHFVVAVARGRRCGQERDCYETQYADPSHRRDNFGVSDNSRAGWLSDTEMFFSHIAKMPVLTATRKSSVEDKLRFRGEDLCGCASLTVNDYCGRPVNGYPRYFVGVTPTIRRKTFVK